MEDIEIINMWKAQNAKIEQSLRINNKVLRELTNQKIQGALKPFLRIKTTGIIAAIVWLLILGWALGFALTHYSTALYYFILSTSAIFLINVKALADYIRHVYMANHLNYTGSVIEIQQQLTAIQLSIVRHAKIMFLQIPFFTTFHLSNSWFPHNVGWGYILFQITLTSSFTFVSVWLYKNFTPENLHKKWVKSLMAGSGGDALLKAMEFSKEIEDFKNEE